MKIVVDADACPVRRQIVRVARRYGISVVMVGDNTHRLEDGYSTVVTVDRGPDSADLKLANLLACGDIVVTQDYGVAALALARGAAAVNQNGMAYTDENLDTLLWERHVGRKLRRAGGRTSGPPRRTAQDDVCFERALELLVTRRQCSPGTPGDGSDKRR